jgi:predicted Fe-Mo cluster-binding NifX family protein
MGKISKIAIPVLHDCICGKFEEASNFIIYTSLKDVILNEESVPVPSVEIEKRVLMLKEYGVSEILTKKAEIRTLELLNKLKINVFIGVNGNDPYPLIKEYLQGNLLINEETII